MPAEKCSECGKTVYVTEKLTILNRTWHKWCFKCTTCKQVLTMKNYSAVGGKPYCKTHYPAPGKDKEGPAPEAGSTYGDPSRGANQVISDSPSSYAGGGGGYEGGYDQGGGGGGGGGGYEENQGY